MVAEAKVLENGCLTVPKEVMDEVGAQPGSTVTFRATGPRTVEMSVRPRLTYAEWIERYPITEPIDEATAREEWQDEAYEKVFGSRHG